MVTASLEIKSTGLTPPIRHGDHAEYDRTCTRPGGDLHDVRKPVGRMILPVKHPTRPSRRRPCSRVSNLKPHGKLPQSLRGMRMEASGCGVHRRGSTPGPACQTSGLEPVQCLPKFPHIFRVPSLGSSLHASQGTGRGSRTKLLKEVDGDPNNRFWHRTAPRRISDSNGATMINCCMIRSAPQWVPQHWQPGLASAVQGKHVDNHERPRLVSRGANRRDE